MKIVFKNAGKRLENSATMRGAAQAFDFKGSIAGYRLGKYRVRSVESALMQDWQTVGQTFRRAVDKSKTVHGWQ